MFKIVEVNKASVAAYVAHFFTKLATFFNINFWYIIVDTYTLIGIGKHKPWVLAGAMKYMTRVEEKTKIDIIIIIIIEVKPLLIPSKIHNSFDLETWFEFQTKDSQDTKPTLKAIPNGRRGHIKLSKFWKWQSEIYFLYWVHFERHILQGACQLRKVNVPSKTDDCKLTQKLHLDKSMMTDIVSKLSFNCSRRSNINILYHWVYCMCVSFRKIVRTT